MLDDLREASLVDIRIKMTINLAIVTWSIFFILYVFSSFLPFGFLYGLIGLAVSLFISNLPALLFIQGVSSDKGWVLSIIGIENDNVIPKSKAVLLRNYGSLLGCAVISLLLGVHTELKSFIFNCYASAIVLWVYFTSRMITQVMGFYIYWVSRINNDSKLKTNAPDNIILERSLECANVNYRGAGLIIALLFISLAAGT